MLPRTKHDTIRQLQAGEGGNKKKKTLLLGRGVTSGAGASVLQVKAQRTLTAEGASRVHAPGAQGARAAAALVHVCEFNDKLFKFSDPMRSSSGAAENSPWLQVGPVQNCWQRQVNRWPWLLAHIPPFTQGLEAQGFPADGER